MQPCTLSQPSVVQPLPSSQLAFSPLLHLPLAQTSPTVHGSSSLHGLVLATNWQPAFLSQLSSVQGLPSSHFTSGLAQLPATQKSPTVQAFPSSQKPSVIGCWQPSLMSQPSLVHGFLSSQSTLPPPKHAPVWHMSFSVHALPSSHNAALKACTQPLLSLQVSSVQGF